MHHIRFIPLLTNFLFAITDSNIQLTLYHNEFVDEIPGEICDLRDINLHFLWADCSPPTVKVPCPADCCTICFEGYDDDGGPNSGGTSPVSSSETSHIVVNDDSDLMTKLSFVSADNGMKLLDMNSPQYHAYSWLVEDSNGQSYSDGRLYQRYALATLYFATNGVQWRESGNWITSADECDWFGISGCSDADEDTIVAIELFGNNLQGSLPPEAFLFFPSIKVMNLASNQLKGPIPPEVDKLLNVGILELAENQLSGNIPSGLGRLTNLDHLFLQSNKLTGAVPSELCDLRTSQSLGLLWVDCNGDPPPVQCSSTCCTTCFTNEPITATPDVSTGRDDSLFVMPLTHSDSNGSLLTTLKKMAHDGGASLDDTSTSQYKAYGWLVESDRSSLTDVMLLQRYALATLYFSTAGSGWSDKSYWLSDEEECPSDNAISRNWYGVEECDAGGMVTRLILSSQNMVGTIPPELTHLRMLKVLDVSENELYGVLPTQMGLFQELEILRLGSNFLDGAIPSELGSLVTLQELYLHVNKFEGEMPEEICDLTDESGLELLWTDCGGNPPMVSCREFCCTECFDDNSEFRAFQNETYGSHYPTFSPTQTNDLPTTPRPTFGNTDGELIENPELKTFLLSHMDGFEDSLSDVDSYAYKAYLWLANTRNYEELSPFNKLQR